MENNKNYVRVNNKEEQKALKVILHPDKDYFEDSLATELFNQYGNSECYNIKNFPCVVNFNQEPVGIINAFNTYQGLGISRTPSEEKFDFFIKPLSDHLSPEGVLHHSSFASAIGDFFDSLIMYS